MDFSDKKIGFAVTGSFCTLKSALEMLKSLAKTNCEIIPIVSETVATTDTRFFKAQDFLDEVEKITGKKPIKSITEAEPIGPKKLLDLLIIAPCTGNTLSKIYYGITDTAVTMSAKAHLRNSKPLLIGVSTNDGLGNNAKNIGGLINIKNIFFIPFRQDDAVSKPTSVISDFSLLEESSALALQNKQMQPIIL